MTDNHENSEYTKKIISLLKGFYKPNSSSVNEDQEFEVFFKGIEKKIDDNSMQNKVSSISSDLEDQFIARQQRLFQAKNRLESGFLKKKKKKFQNNKLFKTAIFVILIFLGLGLASIARLKFKNKFKPIDNESKQEVFNNLELSQQQKKTLDKLATQWSTYKNFELEKIQIVKLRLAKNLNKKKPDLSLIDKYQREIFDLEQNLSQQEFNYELEKTLVLNVDQRLLILRKQKV